MIIYIEILAFFAGSIILYALAVFIIFKKRLSIAKKIAQNAIAFTNRGNGERFRMLILGDDIMAGAGADNPQKSIAGRMAKAIPYCEISNHAKSGLIVKTILDNIPSHVPEKFYDIILIHAGMNDILHNMSAEISGRYMIEILSWAWQYGKLIILATPGNIGAAPMLPFPLGWWYERRARIFRNAFGFIAAERNVPQVVFFDEAENDLFARDVSKYYARDFLHPSDEGYGILFEKIKSVMVKQGFKLQ